MHDYSVHGLRLRSDAPLVGLNSAAFAEPDVLVHFCRDTEFLPSALTEQPPYYNESLSSQEENTLSARQHEGAFLLQYGASAEFLIDQGGAMVRVRRSASTSDEVISAYLIGPVLGLTLRLHGVLCLHASGIEMGGMAFAIMGPRGAGKSTLAASFAHSGRTVLSDDILRLQEAGGGFFAHPSGTRFKLWPDSLQAIYGESESFDRLARETEKRVVAPIERRNPAAVRLRAVFSLEDRSPVHEAPLIEEMHPMDAMVSLASHTYANYLLTPEMRKKEFAQLQRLVSSVEVRKITPRADLTQLVQLREFIGAYFEKQLETI